MTLLRLLRIGRHRFQSRQAVPAGSDPSARSPAFDLLVGENMAAGMTPEEARRAAKRALGNARSWKIVARTSAASTVPRSSPGRRVRRPSAREASRLHRRGRLSLAGIGRTRQCGVMEGGADRQPAAANADRLVMVRSVALDNPAQSAPGRCTTSRRGVIGAGVRRHRRVDFGHAICMPRTTVCRPSGSRSAVTTGCSRRWASTRCTAASSTRPTTTPRAASP